MKRLLAAGLAVGAAMIIAAPGAAIAVASPKTQHQTKSKAITFRGPQMYDWATGKLFAKDSTVTVTQDTQLVNQMIQVSWTGFTPSQNTPYIPGTTDYPVMVAECDRLRPTNPDQCFDATNAGNTETLGQYGPSNTAYSVTLPNGTGSADIQVFTNLQNQFLGCGPSHPCSLAIVPSQGGNSVDYNPPHCSDHSLDNQFTDLATYAFTTLTNVPSSQCSWDKRIIVPLHFAPTPSGCPLRAANFTAQGSPMLARAMEQWQSGLCEGNSPITIQYNSSVNEAEARDFYASGLTDVAFTTAPIASGTSTKHPYTYAPVAVSATSIAYWVDNTATQLPYTNMKLNARLVAKLLTTSYNFSNEGCPGSGAGQFGCDNAVDGNPNSLFTDPEFEHLNPAITNSPAESIYQVPTIMSGESDMTSVATSWIAADKDASGFLAGTFDPWGMHINTDYLGLKYPTDEFTTQDSYWPLASQYSPTFPLSKVAYYQALNWTPGTQDTKDSVGNYEALGQQTVGERGLFAIVDQADAAAFLFPVAALKNHAGKYVEPTMTSMAAAVKDMTANPDGITRSVNENSGDPKEYPLTMVIYAVVPTGGISQAKAAKIAQFLDFAANAGQKTGNNPGELPAGYLPMPTALREQTLKAAQEVLDQTGDAKKAASTPPPSTAPTHPATRPSATPSPSPSSSSPESSHEIAVSFSRPDTTGMSWIVLALLIAGFVFAVSGPAALVYSSPRARAALRTGRLRLSKLISTRRNR